MTNQALVNKINALIVLRDSGVKNQGEIDVLFAAFEQINVVALSLPTSEHVAYSAAIAKIG